MVVRFRDALHHGDPNLLKDFLQACVSCQGMLPVLSLGGLLTILLIAFTTQQVEMLKTAESACQSALSATFVHPNCHFATAQDPGMLESPYGALAKEFGINEDLVQALAHRLGDFY